MPRSPQPDMLRTQTGSDARFSQPSPGAACGAHPLSSWWRRYGVALAALGVVGLVRYLLAPSLDDRAVFMIFLCAVMLSAWYGGLRPGLLATGLSVPIILYGFLPPRYTPALALVGDSFVLVLFLAAGVAISLLIGHLHLARQRAEAWAYDKAQAEEALKVAKAEAERRTQSAEAAERLLHTLLAHVPEGITIATGPPDFPIVAHSRLALELLDRPETDLVDIPAGQHLQAYGLFLADGRTRPTPEQIPLYRACHLGETISNEEWVIERLDGRRMTVLVNVGPIRDSAGQIIGAISCWRDISEHKRAQQLFERAVEAAPSAMLVVNQEGRIRLVNSHTEQLFGYRRQELVGQRIETLVPERLRRQHVQDRDQFMQQPSTRPMGAGRDLYGLCKDGSEVPVEIGLNPIQTDEGRSILATVVDITARQQRAAEAERQQREDQAFAEIVQTLNASLDLDTVLQGVVGAARELSHSERALMFLREPGAETMVTRYQVGYPEMPFANLRIEPGKGIGGQVLATGRPQRTADYATDPRFSKEYLPRMRAGGRLAVLTVPITIGDQVEGVLYVSNPFAQPFTARHESVLLRLAAYAATALHNAQLYQQVQEALAEQRQTEAALQQAHAVVHEQRERLHVTLSSIGDAVLVTDSHGRGTFLNPVATALTGWPEAEALGQDNTAVFHIVNEYTRLAVENPIARVIREGAVVGLANHTLLIARDGVARPIDDSAAPIRDAQGRLVGVVLVFRDITARRQAEAERAQQEAAQRFLAEASTLLASSLETTTQLEHLARLLVPTLGDWCSIDLLQDGGDIHRVAVVHADPTKAALAEQLRQQYPRLAAEASHTLVRVLRTGQSWFDPAVSADRLRAEARDAAHWELEQALGFTAELVVPLLARGRVLGTITCVLGEGARRYHTADLALAEDLARRAALALDNARLYQEARSAQAALQQANATLEQRVAERTAALEQTHHDLRREMAERQRMQEALFQQEKLAALGTLLANVAHELNNPLAVAAMQLDNLQEEGGSGAWREDVEILRQALERCQSVVQSFLALARQEPPTRSAVALHPIIGAVLVLLERALEADGIAVERHVAEDLPLLWADPHQLHHVVANLIANAHHALRQLSAPRQLRLTAAATADRSQVRLEVADSGPGIPEDLQRRVFEPFFTTKPQGLGSGLGLSLCRSIVEGHGGTIQIASQPGHGTTVSVILPVATSEAQTPATSFEPVEPGQTQSGTILLIDDDPGVQRALRRLLQLSGHDITTAANGQEGLSALESHSYEVILCDMRMPGLDGPGFYRELERRHPHLLSRVVFLTGDVLTPEAQAFFAQVDRPRLEKPFKAQEVRRVIQQVLASQ